MAQIFLAIAAILGGLSVAAGAFGSHALKERLSDRALEVFDIATRYQMYHALAILLVAVLLSRAETVQSLLTASASAFLVGVLLFCGSLYAISLSGVKWLGGDRTFRWLSLDGGLGLFSNRGFQLQVSHWTKLN
ncbi:DUF423 domain-containing protein [Leptothermofonsia sp. ETS-13]|uniref:DUF423 domain-containing protein n=1 Tax=Leptothermofonsia sp. ETS-13 TaxID=3035696 RepID=UPI003BA08663